MQPSSNQASAVTIDPLHLRAAKRFVLLVIGPLYFIFIAFVPLLCGQRRGFRGWFWRTVKRACSQLLWLLSIRAVITEGDRDALANDTNSIIVINHRSHLDGFALMDVLPDAKWITFAAKKELCDAALLRHGFKGAGLVEIDRKSGGLALETLNTAVQSLPQRSSIVLFPEGTRSRSESLGAFKAGAVLVARSTRRTIRPIVIHSSDQLLPPGKFFPSSGTIRVEVLPPFECDLCVSVDDDVARLKEQMVTAFEDGLNQ
ncbi:MAG: lysophospholipid acyltransferase family protein [Pseudomonadota bacterium]